MEPTSFYADVLDKLRAIKHSELGQVSREAGIPRSTLLKIRYGEVTNPGVLTVEKLHNHFRMTSK